MGTPGAGFECPSCHKRYVWKTELAGKKVRCKCGNVLRVSAAAPIAAPPPVPSAQEPVDDGTYGLDDLASLERSGRVLDEPVYREPASVANATAYSPAPAGAARAPARAKKGPGFGAKMFVFFAESASWQVLWGVGLVVGAIAIGIFSYVMQTRHEAFMKVAQHTIGRIEDVPSITKSGRAASRLNPDNWTFRFPVSYAVNAKGYRAEVSLEGTHLVNGLTPDNINSWPGRQIEVYYDPKDPAHAEAGAEAEGKNWFWGYVIAVMFLGGGVWRILKSRSA